MVSLYGMGGETPHIHLSVQSASVAEELLCYQISARFFVPLS
jgi:hypothetical protein